MDPIAFLAIVAGGIICFFGYPWDTKKGEVPVRRFGKYLRFRLSELQGGQGSNGNGDPQA